MNDCCLRARTSGTLMMDEAANSHTALRLCGVMESACRWHANDAASAGSAFIQTNSCETIKVTSINSSYSFYACINILKINSLDSCNSCSIVINRTRLNNNTKNAPEGLTFNCYGCEYLSKKIN